MTIVVTGATEPFGRPAIEALLAQGVPVKVAPYEDLEALTAAFAGADQVLFVSGSEPGGRIEQHRNVVEAAKAAGVGRVVYTSAPKADTTDMKLAADHKATEELLAESGVPNVILRNGWYIDNYNVDNARAHGLFGASADGRIAGATRADLAEAAASALLTDDHAKTVYELGGEPFTMTELAAEISRQSGQEVTYTDLGEEKYAEMLIGVGLPAEFAAILADSDRAAAHGALFVERTDLETLLGRPATPLATAIGAALKS